ncbi:MAG: hypothetical protein ACXVCY_17275 [Pseudobdellovibrionaceae bacterium]
MKYVFFTSLVISTFSIQTFAEGRKSLTCTEYHLPSDCTYDPYDLRGWDCGRKHYPTDASGNPYDYVKHLNISFENGRFRATEVVTNSNGGSEKVLVDLENLVCISEIRNCETSDRNVGVYLVEQMDQDGSYYNSLQLRTGNKIKEITTAAGCDQINNY